MRLYSIQLLPVWKRAQRTGYLVGGDGSREGPGFQRAYRWMRSQMSQRIAHFSGDYPVWAWVKRPDLRETGHLPGGVKGVLLTLEVPKSRVLVSDFVTWHFVLGSSYLPKPSEKVDNVAIHNKSIGWRSRVASWDQIFTPSRISRYYSAGDKIQASIDRVYLNEVVHVQHFAARRSWIEGLPKVPKKRTPPYVRLRAAYGLGRNLWFAFNIAKSRDDARRDGGVVIFPFWNRLTTRLEQSGETLRVSEVARETLAKFASPLKDSSKEIDESLRDLNGEILRHNPASVGKAFTLGFYLVQMQIAVGESLNLKDKKTLAGIRSDVAHLVKDLDLGTAMVANVTAKLKELRHHRVDEQRESRLFQDLDGFFMNLNANTGQFRSRV